MDSCDGKAALITGGSNRFGLTAAQLLADRGADVIITGHTQATLDRAVEQLGANAVAVRTDAASLAGIDALADRVKAEFGRLDLLFVNAGVTGFAAVDDMTEDVCDELFAINAKGPYFIVQKLAPLMRDGSAIVLTTSVSNVRAWRQTAPTQPRKAAVRSMTRSFARELQPRGVRVNAAARVPSTPASSSGHCPSRRPPRHASG